MAKVTENNFKATLMDLMKTTTGLQNDIQKLVMFAMTYCANTGNTLYLTMLRTEVNKRKGLNDKTLDGYIRHMLPVQWAEAKDGKMVYKKAGELVINPEPAFSKWSDWSKEPKGPTEKTLKRLIKSLEGYASPAEGTVVEPAAQSLAVSALAMLDQADAA